MGVNVYHSYFLSLIIEKSYKIINRIFFMFCYINILVHVCLSMFVYMPLRDGVTSGYSIWYA